MNSADSERIEGQLMSLGIRPLGEEEFLVSLEGSEDGGGKKKKKEKRKPDVIVLNTCSIRDHAEQKVYS
jgi:tRNA-2-methylthio-N6-dimethylallyladenosine synthase